MASVAVAPVVTQQPSLEDKILAAVSQSEQVIDIFSAPIAEVVKTGVAVEPIIEGFAKLIIGLFRHHVSK